jgi:molybdate transport system substrate-binding protein
VASGGEVTAERGETTSMPMGGTRAVASLVVAVMAAGCGGCGGSDDDGAGATEESDRAGAAGVAGTVRVLAAASLTDAFEEVAGGFEAEHPGVEVDLSFAGSSALVQQVADGAPADVLATADERTMDDLLDQAGDSVLGEPRVVARNHLVLVVPAGNPGDVTGLGDLSDDDLFVGLCAAEVPCGHLSAEAFDEAGISPAVDSYEPDVRSLLTKLVAGELDAGLVYRTDARAAGGEVDVVAAPELRDRATSYPIVALDAGENPSGGAAFVAHVRGAAGREVLRRHGFTAP